MIAAGLLLLNALLAAAEFALGRVRPRQIEDLANEGRRGAGRVHAILADLDDYLFSVHILILLLILSLGWIAVVHGGSVAANFLLLCGYPSEGFSLLTPGRVGSLLAFLAMACTQVLLGSLLPRALAQKYSIPTCLWLSWLVFQSHRLLSPLTWVLNKAFAVLIKGLGLRAPHMEGQAPTAEELAALLDSSRQAGLLGAQECSMLTRVLRFPEMTVREIMVPSPDIVALELHASQEQVTKKVFESGYSRLPIYEGDLDHIIGIVYVKDLIYTLHHPKLIKLADLVRPVLEVPETRSISPVLRQMQQRRTHMAVVVDEFGATSGLVTLEDIVEEIVGEIQDETDQEPVKVERLADGTLLIDCKLHLEEFAEIVKDQRLPEGDFDTVGGLVIHLADRLPREGDSFRLGAYSIRVVKREGRRLRKVALRQVPAGTSEPAKQAEEEAQPAQTAASARVLHEPAAEPPVLSATLNREQNVLEE